MEERTHAASDDRTYEPPAVRSLGRVDEFTQGDADGSQVDTLDS